MVFHPVLAASLKEKNKSWSCQGRENIQVLGLQSVIKLITMEMLTPPQKNRTLILSQQRPAWPEQKAKIITHYVKQVKLPIETSSHSMAWLLLCNCLWNFVYTQRPSLHRLVLGRWRDHLRVGGRDMGMKLVLNPACRAWAEDMRGWLARTESANSVE